MKIFGSISELVDLAFRLAGGKQVKLRSAAQNAAANATTIISIPDVAPGGSNTGDQNMVLEKVPQTLLAKTLTSPTISGGTINNTVIGGSTPAAGSFTDIVGATLDINTSAELQTLTIPSMSTAGILHNNSSGVVSSSLIVNADVDAAAAIAFSKLASLTSGNILIGSSTNVPTARAVTGDVTIDNLGATTIGAGKVTDGMLAGNIARNKLATGTAYRMLTNDASGVVSENAALSPSEAVATDANGQLVTVAGVSATELGYLSAVTSDIQAQLNSKQAADATLTAIAGVTTAANKYIYFDGVDTAQAGTITSFGRSLLDDVDAADARTNTLGLSSMATMNPASVTITGGTVRGVALDRLAVESDTAAISSGTLVPSKGLMIITAGDNTLNTLNPGVGFNLVNGAVVTLINNEGADVTVTNAGNIQTGTGSDFVLKQGAASSFIWSTTLSKWVLSGGAGGAGGLATAYVTAGGITAVNNTHYLTNLSASGQTITLPAGANGNVIRFSDAGEKWNVYPLTIAPATGEKINNLATNETLVCDVKGGWVELSYNSTYGGWALMSLASTTGTSGSGSGEINAISNPSAASDTTGWTNATRVTSGSPLDPVVSTALSIANSAGAESSTSGGYFSIASLPSGLRSRKLKVSFYFSTPATDVYRVSVYAGSTRLSLSSDSSGATTLPANVSGGYFEASFDSTTATAYSLNITRTSGSTGACTITQVIVGPGINAQGAAISDAQSYPSTVGGLGTISSQTFRYYRVGSFMHLMARFTYGTRGAGNANFTLPSGLTVDTSVTGVGSNIVGTWAAVRSTAVGIVSDQNLGVLAVENTTSIYFARQSNFSVFTPQAGTAVFAADSQIVTLEARIPIAEWAGNGTVNLGAGAQVEYAATSGTWDANSSTTVYGPGGQAIGGALSLGRSKTVTWQYPIQPDDQITVEASRDQITWVPINGFNSTAGAVIPGLDASGTIFSGVIFHNSSSTQTVVSFGQYISIASDDSPLTNWPSSNAFWRVRKAKASSPVGFGKANSTEFGLVAPRRGQQALTVTGTTTGTVASTSNIRSVGIYYQDQDGNHRFKFNIVHSVGNGTYTGCSFSITGVTFKNTANFFQPVSCGVSGQTPAMQARAEPNSSIVQVFNASIAGINGYSVSGDVELESRPTWA